MIRVLQVVNIMDRAGLETMLINYYRNIDLLHVTTTPSVAYIARVDDFDCGIMISASHNPYYDNGIKLIDCYGEKMPEETLLLVEDYIDGKLHVFDKLIRNRVDVDLIREHAHGFLIAILFHIKLSCHLFISNVQNSVRGNFHKRKKKDVRNHEQIEWYPLKFNP